MLAPVRVLEMVRFHSPATLNGKSDDGLDDEIMTRMVGSRTNRRSKATIDHDNYSTHSKEASINWIPFSAFPLLSCSFHSATGSETRSMTFRIPGSAFGPN